MLIVARFKHIISPGIAGLGSTVACRVLWALKRQSGVFRGDFCGLEVLLYVHVVGILPLAAVEQSRYM